MDVRVLWTFRRGLGLWFYWWFRDTPAEEYPSVEAGFPRASSAPSLSRSPTSTEEDAQTPWASSAHESFDGGDLQPAVLPRCAAMFFASWFATYLKETRGVSWLRPDC